jgi:hypothetical protein
LGEGKMSEVKGYTVEKIDSKFARPFVQKWHYSKTLPASVEIFGLFRKNELIGVAAYGHPAMRNQANCYDIDIELRRLCLIDDTPKNAESRFISLTIKQLKKVGYKAVLSLADPEHGHIGTIYKASNFEYLGEERGGGSRLIVIDGEPIHSRSAWAKYGTSGINSLKKLLGEDRVQGRNKKRKHIYRYQLKSEG